MLGAIATSSETLDSFAVAESVRCADTATISKYATNQACSSMARNLPACCGLNAQVASPECLGPRGTTMCECRRTKRRIFAKVRWISSELIYHQRSVADWRRTLRCASNAGAGSRGKIGAREPKAATFVQASNRQVALLRQCLSNSSGIPSF